MKVRLAVKVKGEKKYRRAYYDDKRKQYRVVKWGGLISEWLDQSDLEEVMVAR